MLDVVYFKNKLKKKTTCNLFLDTWGTQATTAMGWRPSSCVNNYWAYLNQIWYVASVGWENENL